MAYVVTSTLPSQPAMHGGSSHTLGTSVWKLSAFRAYSAGAKGQPLINQFGGVGKHHYADAHGKVFESENALEAFQIERGYIVPWGRMHSAAMFPSAFRRWQPNRGMRKHGLTRNPYLPQP